MKSVYLLICFVLIITSCNDQPQGREIKHPAKKDQPQPTPLAATTAITVRPFETLEEPFYIDSLMVNDTTDEHANIFRSYFPQSKDSKYRKLSLSIRTYIENYFSVSRNVSTEGSPYYLDCWLTGCSVYKDFVSMEFTEQEYTHGAAHYVHGFKTCNFDVKKQKEIGLLDFLLFKEGEIEKFCDVFNPDPSSNTDQQTVYLNFYDFSETRSFLIADDGIVLLFNDYEKEPSITYMHIPYTKIRSFVNPEYRYLFE